MGNQISRDPPVTVLCELEGGPHDGEYRRLHRGLLLADGVSFSDGSTYLLAERREEQPWLVQHIALREKLAARGRRHR